MLAETISVNSSAGRILCSTIFRSGGKKLLGKGHILSNEDVRMLEVEGMNEVWVTLLEAGEISEDDAVMRPVLYGRHAAPVALIFSTA